MSLSVLSGQPTEALFIKKNKIKLLFKVRSEEALLFPEIFSTKSTRVYCAGHKTSHMKLN